MTSALDLHQKTATLGLLDKVSAERLFYCRTRRFEAHAYNLTRLTTYTLWSASTQHSLRSVVPSCLAQALGAASIGPCSKKGAY